MRFLLDTNVVSEWVKPHPNTGVTTWLSTVDEDSVFLSVITVAELRHGIERMPASARRDRLAMRLQKDLLVRFEGRVLAIDLTIAERVGFQRPAAATL